MSITGSNNPFACEPVVFANANSIVSLGTITRDGNQFTFSVGFVWKINGVTYQNTTPVVITIAEASTGFQRIDNALLNTSNTIELQQGLESDTIALRPVAPDTNIVLTSWNISGDAIEDTETPITGAQFKQKTENQSYNYSTTGSNVILPLPGEGQSHLIVENEDIVSIDGFDKSILILVRNGEYPYEGKDYLFENKSPNPVQLNHLTSAEIPSILPNEENVVVPSGGSVWFKFKGEKMAYIMKSWNDPVDLSSKADLVGGKVPASQLPSYVDDVIEGYFNGVNFYTDSGFTNLITPESSKIYVTLDTNLQYRWSGSAYVQIGGNEYLKKDIATYPIASFPLADTDKLLLFQGGVPKKLDKSDLYKQTTITVELMTNLTSDFYAPNDLIIHSTDIIRGSGIITLKVENVAYTLGQLINRGNKITVETTTPSVYNLNTTPTNTNWQRPADWLPMPTNITATDQTFVGLHAVIENSDNYCAFSFTTSAGQYRVDWGDGNVTLHNSGTIAQYQYNYATVSNATLSSRGYKQAMVKVTPVSGNLLTCNFQQRFVTTPVQNQPYSSGFLECILSMPNASSGLSITLGGTTVRHTYCEKVEIKTIGNVTNLTSVFYNFHSLKSLPLFNTINVVYMASMFNGCCSLQFVPLFNTINVINMGNMFTACYSLQSVPLFNTANVNTMIGMFYNCFSLQYVPLFNTINVNNMISMFYSCYSLKLIPAFITTAVTSDFTNFAYNCSSINRILMSFNRTVTLQYCQLSRDALVEIFTNLTNRTSTTSATIDITGNWGASALTSSDRLIATNKNWVITG